MNSFRTIFIVSLLCYQTLTIEVTVEDEIKTDRSVGFELRNNGSVPIEIIWVDTSREPATHRPMFVLPVNQSGYLASYGGHQFLFQSHALDASTSSSFFYTKLDQDESLILSHDEALSLSYSVSEDSSADFRDENPPERKNRSGLPLHERFANYVSPPEKFYLTVRNNASVPLYVFLSMNSLDQHLLLEPPLSPQTESQYDALEGQLYHISTSSEVAGEGVTSFSFTKGLFDETLIVSDDGGSEPPDQSKKPLQLKILSPFDHYTEMISSLLKFCGFFNEDAAVDTSLSDAEAEAEGKEHLELKRRQRSCLSENAFIEIDELLKQRASLVAMRDTMAPLLRNYTCDDDSLLTSPPLETRAEVIHDGTFEVKTLFQMESAQIFVIPNFLTSEECDQLVETSRDKLERAAVVGANGAAEYSESRRAQQAGYYLSGEEDPLWNLYARVLNFTNSHSNYGLRPEGQEEFTVIQYSLTDEYLSHCDGDCDGSIHRTTGRIATAVLYCKVPEAGGATTFTKANVIVRPEPLAAAFFTYMGPDGQLDSGYTEHSGCPIRKGEKWIATAWMREGVSLEHPHTLYDPSGFLNSNPDEIYEEGTQQQHTQEQQQTVDGF